MPRVVLVLAVAWLVARAPSAHADTSKLAKEGVRVSDRAPAPAKNKLCCGYPLSEDLGFALRFYWLATEKFYLDEWEEEPQDLYTAEGYYLGTFPESYVESLRMEGSGLLADGRVINYAGRCRYGVGKCFEEVDRATHPFGRGAGRLPLVPFRSVAVDRNLIEIGEPIYIPEFDGMRLPDGTIHDGCVRADDTGSAIKKRKMDFFVVSHDNFRWLLRELWGVIWITPHIEAPRCDYLRQDD